MPLVAKDVVNVLIPVKIQIWRSRAQYSVGRIVTVVRTNVVWDAAHAQEALKNARSVVRIKQKMLKVNIQKLKMHLEK